MNTRQQPSLIKQIVIASFILCLLLGVGIFFLLKNGKTVSGKLPQDMYIWQRQWSNQVSHAIKQTLPVIDRYYVLVTEVSWEGKIPHEVHVDINKRFLEHVNDLGICLRIGPYSNDFTTQIPQVKYL